MKEYLIQRTDGQWFDLHITRFGDALRPTSFAVEHIEGRWDYRIRTQGVEISFSYEDPGIQVAINGDLSDVIADQIVDEVRVNIERVTNQKGQVVKL